MEEHDFEEAFRRLTAELAKDDDFLADPPEEATGGRKICVALVLAPFDSAQALGALLKITNTAAEVVKLDPWAAAYLEVRGELPEEDASTLLTGSRPAPPAVDRVARVISRISRFGSVAIVSWLSEDNGFEPGVSGMVTAKRYVGGEPEEDISAGVLLGSLGSRAEDLLLGRARPEDFPDDEEGGWKRFFRRDGR